MKVDPVRWLERELPRWVDHGLVTAGQSEAIRGLYGETASLHRRLMAVVSSLGALLIGAGIILLLAYNWYQFGRPLRAAMAFAPLLASLALTAWVLARRFDSAAWREASATLTMLSLGACIALVSQIYQIPGNLANFLLTWTLLSLPLLYLLDASLAAVLYMAGVTGWCIEAQRILPHALLYWPLMALAVPHILIVYRREWGGQRPAFLGWSAALTLSVGVGVSLERNMPGLWIPIYASLYALMFLAAGFIETSQGAFWRQPLGKCGLLGGVILALIFTLEGPWQDIGWHSYRHDYHHHGMASIVDYVLLTALMGGVVVLLVKTLYPRPRGQWVRGLLGLMPLAALAGFSYAAATEILWPPMLFFNIYVVALGVAVLREGVLSGRLGTVNGGLAIIAAWAMVKFFDEDISMLLRGVVFIALGAAFLGVNLVWLRRKERQS